MSFVALLLAFLAGVALGVIYHAVISAELTTAKLKAEADLKRIQETLNARGIKL